MAGQAVKHKVNIGLTSLILIFIILCLATFSLLSLSSARGDQSLAVRSAQAVTEYYRADAQGEKWLKQADAILQKETIGVMSQDEIKTLAGNVALELGCNVDEKTGYISTDISMERGQALHIDRINSCPFSHKISTQSQIFLRDRSRTCIDDTGSFCINTRIKRCHFIHIRSEERRVGKECRL